MTIIINAEYSQVFLETSAGRLKLGCTIQPHEFNDQVVGKFQEPLETVVRTQDQKERERAIDRIISNLLPRFDKPELKDALEKLVKQKIKGVVTQCNSNPQICLSPTRVREFLSNTSFSYNYLLSYFN